MIDITLLCQEDFVCLFLEGEKGRCSFRDADALLIDECTIVKKNLFLLWCRLGGLFTRSSFFDAGHFQSTPLQIIKII